MFRLFIDYSKWHYTQAVVNIFVLAKEFARFFFNLFSVSLFLRSLFLPVFSIPVNDVESEGVFDMVAVFIGGILIRIVSAIFRLGFIAVGLLLNLLTVVFFSLVFVLWITVPLILIFLAYCLLKIS